MDRSIREWMSRQTARDYKTINVTLKVDEAPKRKPKAAKPHYKHIQRQRTQDPDKDLIKEIVREVVSEVIAQMEKPRSCEECQNNRGKKQSDQKRTDDLNNFHYEWKPNGSIEYRNR